MKFLHNIIKENGLEEFHPKERTSIAIIITNSENKNLIMQRSLQDSDGAGLWDIVGGSVDTTDPHHCAIRELEEEANLTTDGLHFFKEIVYDCPWINGKKIRFVFEHKTDTEPKVSFEHEQYKWVTAEELESHTFFLDYLKNVVLQHAKIQESKNSIFNQSYIEGVNLDTLVTYHN